MREQHTLKAQAWQYLAGFGTALALTAIAFWLASSHALTGSSLVVALMGLASIQLIVQLVCFLHVAQEDRPRWNLTKTAVRTDA